MAGRLVYIKMNKTRAGQLGQWKEAKKLEAVTIYLATGSFVETTKITEIPVKTLRGWATQDWWKEAVERIRSEENSMMDVKMSKTIDKALDKVMDLIENGEHVYDQHTGKIKRVPAKLRDVNHAFNSILDKRQLLRKQPTKIVEQQSTALQLQNLAEHFAKFVGKAIKKEAEMEFIEGTTVFQNEDGTYEVKGE